MAWQHRQGCEFKNENDNHRPAGMLRSPDGAAAAAAAGEFPEPYSVCAQKCKNEKKKRKEGGRGACIYTPSNAHMACQHGNAVKEHTHTHTHTHIYIYIYIYVYKLYTIAPTNTYVRREYIPISILHIQ